MLARPAENAFPGLKRGGSVPCQSRRALSLSYGDGEFESRSLQRRVFANLTRSIRSPKILPSELRAASVIHRRCRAVSLGHFAGVGLNLVTSILAPHDQPDAGGGSIAERHRRAGL